MTPRTAAILGAAAAIMLGLGLVFGAGDDTRRDAPPAHLAFPGLAATLQNAAEVGVLHAGTTLHLVRKGEAWMLTEASGYPAPTDKVRALTTALTELQLAEPRTADPKDYARLGVEDTATQVRVLDASGGALAQVIVGHSHVGNGGSGDGVYVRVPGEAQAWLAAGHLSVETDAPEWLDREIVDVPADKLASLTVNAANQTLGFARQGNALAMTAPADHPGLDKFKLEDVGRALSHLAFDAVKPAPLPGSLFGQSVFTSTEGLTVTVTVNKDGHDIWASFAAAGAGAAPVQARVAGWAYRLQGFKQAALAPTMDDLKAYQPPSPAPPAKLPGAK